MITKSEHFQRRFCLPALVLLSLTLITLGNVCNKSLAADAGVTTRDVVRHGFEGILAEEDFAGVLVEVTVVATNDLNPLASAKLSWWMSTLHTNRTAYTDDNGMARIRLPAGNNRISVSKTDWSPQQTVAQVQAGVTNHVTIELIPSPRITGIVRDPSGAPASDVVVSFHPGRFPGACEYAEVRTDKNGRYQLKLQKEFNSGFWSGSINPTNFIMARDYRRNLAAVQEFAVIPTNLDLDLQPGITLTGSVKDTNGAPIASATVKLSMLSGQSIVPLDEQPAKVDAQGIFSFPALPQAREYNVFNGVTAPGFGTAAAYLRASDTKTNHYEFPVFTLKRADRVLAGLVLNADGKPIAGADVRFNGRGQREWPSAKSDTRGHFVFDAVCEGEVQVDGSWNGPTGSGIFMTSNQGGGGAKTQAGDTNIVIVLRDPNVQPYAGAILIASGTVFDPSGAPCPFAAVHVWRSANPFMSVNADGTGKYNIRWQHEWSSPVAPKFNPCVVARLVSRNLVGARDLDETAGDLDIKLQSGGIISGRVQNANGAPLAKASVTLDAELNHASAQLDGTQTDAQGAFRFQALPPAGDYRVRVNATGYGPVFMGDLRVEGSPSNHLELPPVILLPARLRVAGRVIDPDGRPVSNIWLQIGGFSQNFLQPMTDADGRFSCSNLVEGQVRVFATRDAIKGGESIGANITVKAGDTNILVRLAPNWRESAVPCVTSGTVYNPAGGPAPGVVLLVANVDSTTNSDANGKFTIKWQVPPARANTPAATSWLFGRDPEHNFAAIVPLDAMTTRLDLHLQPGLNLSGSARDSEGRPVTNALVRLFLELPDGHTTLNLERPVNTDTHGLFSFAALPRGSRYHLWLSADGYGNAELEISAKDAQAASLSLPPILLKPANRQLAGQVIGLDGRPYWGAQVMISGEGQSGRITARTTADGRFSVTNICEGLLDVRAILPPGSGVAGKVSGSVQAHSGDTNVVVQLVSGNAGQ